MIDANGPPMHGGKHKGTGVTLPQLVTWALRSTGWSGAVALTCCWQRASVDPRQSAPAPRRTRTVRALTSFRTTAPQLLATVKRRSRREPPTSYQPALPAHVHLTCVSRAQSSTPARRPTILPPQSTHPLL